MSALCGTCEEAAPVREIGRDYDGVTMRYICHHCWGDKGSWMGEVALPDWDDLGPIVLEKTAA